MLRQLSQCRRIWSQAPNRPVKQDTRWPGWQVIIGIETHAQIKSRRKLFSEAPLPFGLDDTPNSRVYPFDAAFPGTLPKLNQKCVDLALRTAVALDSDIQLRSSFDRKHYFYSDLPSGYQITQQYAPIATGGTLNIQLSGSVSVRIKQIQLEQDTAKSTFNARARKSFIDLNRAGAGLMEIVSEPDLGSPEEAAAYVKALQSVLRAVGASDCNMEKGSLRCDVNVSVNRFGTPPGTRCEIKNLNSVKFMVAAIIHEVARQRAILDNSPDPLTARVPQETRGFDEHSFETFRLRSKEDAPDYRYMPDPNLGVLVLEQDRIETIRKTLPELPSITRKRLKEKYQLSERDVEVLLAVDSSKEVPFDGEQAVEEAGAVAYFDRLCAGDSMKSRPIKQRDPKVVANWMTHELLGQLTARGENFTNLRISSAQLGDLIDLVQNGIITGTSGKLLLRHILDTTSPLSPSQLARDLKLTALSPSYSSGSSQPTELRTLCEQAMSSLPKEVAAARAGNKNVLNKIVGWVMRESRGRADARSVKALVEELIAHGDRS